MSARRMWLADHRGRDAIVVLVPRRKRKHENSDVPTPPVRVIKATAEVTQRYAFTRAYQVRHSNALEYEFLHGLAAHLETHRSVALVGSGARGVGALICERNGTPMKGFLSGGTRAWEYLLVLHLAAFELRAPGDAP